MGRPRLRIPLWAAATIPVAAYLGRSLITGSWALSAADVVVISALGIGLALAARYGSAAQRRRDELTDQVDDGNRTEGKAGEHDDI